MARKGNLPKNGSDAHTQNNRKNASESGSEFSDQKGAGKVNKANIGAGKEHLNGSQPISPLAEGAARANHEGTEKKKVQNSEKPPRRKKQGTEKIQDPKQSVSYESNSTECAGSTSTATTEPSDLREESRRPSSVHGRKFKKFVPKCLPNGFQVENAMANLEVSYNVLCRNLRSSTMSILKITYEWLERQKPMLVTLKRNILQASNYIRTKIEIVYPVVLRFFMYFGNIMLLLSMVWLDCTLRGVDSFLHMGTSSFFSIIWCSALSMIAMIGIFKFLLVLVIPALLGFFVGFTFSILSLVIAGALLLWFYGSFWTTALVIFFGGLAFAFSHERVALFITTGYTVYCAWIYVGWLGLLLGLNLSFISSDALIYFLKSNVNDPTRTSGPFEQTTPTPDPGVDRGPGNPSTSGVGSDITSEDEVIRLLNCTDHYSALGISRFENVDASLLKREYRKKAMLVHPDKNMGNEKAAEAFKKLQNAYEVLLDSIKRRAYDDELKREELLNYFRDFQGTSQKKGRWQGFYPSGFTRPEAEADDPFGESRLMACTKCGNFHVWICTKKEKSRARWCQDCKDFHPAKDGDGWVEQPSQPFFFGLLKKVEAPSAYVCAESKIYDATEWYICQGMRCPANTHKPSFHANTSVASKHNGKGTNSSGHRNGKFEPEESMTEEEFFKWLQNAMQSEGIPGPFGASTSTENHPSARPGNSSKTSGGSASKRTKKGKKQR